MRNSYFLLTRNFKNSLAIACNKRLLSTYTYFLKTCQNPMHTFLIKVHFYFFPTDIQYYF